MLLATTKDFACSNSYLCSTSFKHIQILMKIWSSLLDGMFTIVAMMCKKYIISTTMKKIAQKSK